MPRFVVLRHELPAGHARPAHWDLMLEWGPALRTWAVMDEPFPATQTMAEALADHRLTYLDYEGPVSGDRGSVTRWDQGEYHLERASDTHVQAVLAGARLCGRLLLEKGDGSHFWRVCFSVDPTTA